MTGAGRDDLVRALGARVLLYRSSLDQDAILSPQALAEVRMLMRLVADPSTDPEAVRAIADLHLCRSLVLGAERGRDDAVVAAALARYLGPGGPPETEAETTDRRIALLHEQAGDQVAVAERHRDPALLERALHAARAAVDSTPVRAGPIRASALALWGLALRLRYEREGDPRDLDAAIGALREAGTAAGSRHPGRAGILSALAASLRERHERAGGLEDLLEGVRTARAAVEAGGPDDRGGRLHNLGLALRLRHERTGDQRDLEEAIAVHREAVALTPPGHRDHSLLQQGLANALDVRFELASAAEDLRARMDALEAAVDTTAGAALRPGGELAPDAGSRGTAAAVTRAGALVNLASALARRYELTADGGDADRAEVLLRRAVAILPDQHAAHAVIQYQLGLVLAARDRPEATACLRAAALHPAAAPRLRLRAARGWGHAAMTAGRPEEAVTAYSSAIGQLPALVPLHLHPADAEQALAETGLLAGDSAACALSAGDPALALGLLELGRGVLLGQGMKNGDELTELRGHAPRTADRLAWLRTRLDAADEETTSDERHELAAEWDRLLVEVRSRQGFEDFMSPPHPDRLLSQGMEGPVVVVNVSRYRCDAIAVTAEGLRVVPLPRLALPELVHRAADLLTVLDGLQDPAAADPEAQASAEDEVDGHLRWLWDTVTGPVLEGLGITGPSTTPPPRVWWIPTGPLAFLPLHAAGHHHEGTGRTVLDRTVSSYTPSLRVLARSRRRPDVRAASFLVVAVPEAPAAPPLPGAAEEAAVLTGLLPGARLLTGDGATRDAVVAALRDHTWLHFCGHATAEPGAGSGSRLLVHDHLDHPLTVAGISRLDLSGAELAYLSACHTARTGFTAVDEALHLAGGLQIAGFRHVVGTLWSIDDTVSTRIAERVYAGLGAPRPVAARASHAVREAVRDMRDLYPVTPSLWAAHIHAGP
ncbi:CHAT domain-containing protein [Streptomyces sp. NBC_00102]|uniref:CHAT domain-containing protein n=1 Tax=Streptomyces sp. NBC_00102 TaxID=2975652 RepID=UPI0022580F5C|nr:CHAT domain-containing protein [Streptomyces sp. NBC_00102]MCX5402350.1 CHAT domain-containing protein [Streptomyces sp. NBC_00102]